jgi:hypothetical protein
MGHFLKLTDSSMGNVMSRLRMPRQFNYEPIVNILNVQIKQEMYGLLSEVMIDVLDGLDSELQNAGKTSWTTAFPAILILGIFVKDLEVSFEVCDCFEDHLQPA